MMKVSRSGFYFYQCHLTGNYIFAGNIGYPDYVYDLVQLLPDLLYRRVGAINYDGHT